MSSHETNAIWPLYDSLRSAALNIKYYCRRLESYERLDFWTKLVLAINAPASAIGGWFLWSTPYGKPLWALFGALAAITAVATPLVGISKKIRDYENTIVGYRTLQFDLDQIRTTVAQDHEYSDKSKSDFRQAIVRSKALLTTAPESREKPKIKAKCEDEVKHEFSVDSFYIPGARNDVL